jgi:hypothetical protein
MMSTEQILDMLKQDKLFYEKRFDEAKKRKEEAEYEMQCYAQRPFIIQEIIAKIESKAEVAEERPLADLETEEVDEQD